MERRNNRTGIAVLVTIAAGFAIVNGLIGDGRPKPKPDYSKYLNAVTVSTSSASLGKPNKRAVKDDPWFDLREPAKSLPTYPTTTEPKYATAAHSKPAYAATSYAQRASYEPTPKLPAYDYSRYTDYTYRPAVGEHYVSGYYRSNGTYVSGHYRTNRDNSFWNNYSSYGNVNPHSGRVGTKSPSNQSRR